MKYKPPPEKLTAWQIIDKLLNVSLVVFAVVWIIGYFFYDSDDASSNTDNSIVTLEDAAQKLFVEYDVDGSDKYIENLNTIYQDSEDKLLRKYGNIYEGEGLPYFDEAIINSAIAKSEKKPVVLFVFASWCPHCRKQFPYMNELAKKYYGKIEILGISSDKDEDKINKYIKNLGYKPLFPIYITASESRKAELERVLDKKGLRYTGSIPYTAIITKSKVKKTFTGGVSGSRIAKIIDEIYEGSILDVLKF